MGNKKLYIGNLPHDLDHFELYQLFHDYGEIMDAVVMKNKKTHRSHGWGYVVFTNERDAFSAMISMQKKSIEGQPLLIMPINRFKKVAPNLSSQVAPLPYKACSQEMRLQRHHLA